MNLIKNKKKFIEEENKLRMENHSKILANLNYEHLNIKSININHYL